MQINWYNLTVHKNTCECILSTQELRNRLPVVCFSIIVNKDANCTNLMYSQYDLLSSHWYLSFVTSIKRYVCVTLCYIPILNSMYVHNLCGYYSIVATNQGQRFFFFTQHDLVNPLLKIKALTNPVKGSDVGIVPGDLSFLAFLCHKSLALRASENTKLY